MAKMHRENGAFRTLSTRIFSISINPSLKSEGRAEAAGRNGLSGVMWFAAPTHPPSYWDSERAIDVPKLENRKTPYGAASVCRSRDSAILDLHDSEKITINAQVRSTSRVLAMQSARSGLEWVLH